MAHRRQAEEEEEQGMAARRRPRLSRKLLAAAAAVAARKARASWAEWDDNVELDRTFFTLTTFMFAPYMRRLLLAAPRLMTWAEHAQNGGCLAMLASGVALIRFCPSAYRRHAPALRLAFVLYAFSFPVFSSLPAMEAFVGPAPSASTSPFLNLLVDGYRLWMGTRNALVGLAPLVARSPLRVALPLQAAGLLRISTAGFCRTSVLRHASMQGRIERFHSWMAALPNAFGTPVAHHLVPHTAEGRCQAALLAVTAVLSFLLPLVLLAPLAGKRRGRQAGTATPHDTPLAPLVDSKCN
ncbi:Fatty acid desaturase [Micractinium conductrix]|uniref:Fatty acid desaturase n=1 Tax=Micractinium conductrix TaxID=554055 RepID=A0A2P6V7M0_9CHLO|nr:Fatty acid desaturase [Micractinium conductrix]|eukprot:PSC70084.1 Fatty acid desaturase [Micractinium conductrix]